MSSKKSPTIEESSGDSISLDNKPPKSTDDDEKPIQRDSGVVLNSSTYGSATNSIGRNASSGNFLFNSRSGGRGIGTSGLPMSERGGGYPYPSHAQLVDIRRPSIVEMVNSGGIIINQRGSPEINLNNVPVPDVELMYQSYRRASMDLHSIEDESGRSFQRSSSMGGSSRQLADAAKFTCPSPTQSWWIPKFNSTIIERHFGKVVIEFIRRRFRIALMFIGLFALLWVVFFSVNIPFSPGPGAEGEDSSSNLAYNSVQYSPGYVVGAVILFVVVGALFVLTFTRVYSVTCIALVLSIFLTLVLMVCSFALALALYFDSDIQGFLTMSFVAQFALTAIVILAIFSLSRMPLIISLALSVVYIIILELLVGFLAYQSHKESYPMNVYIHSLIGRVLFYVTLILAGVSTAYLLDIRQHATFWKIAQCVLSQEALELERELKEKTILSMMPKPFADELMKVENQLTFMLKQKLDLEGEESLDPVFQTLSAPFTICSMDTVTILFADIVDFTKFSSDLSAAELVGILNEVFSTFDDLVTKHNCEKISTLGDCYFCVSGCPEPEPSHADNCVNMGLAIIDALEDIRKRTGHPIKMRIGIHTGSVYCGVMGTKRFKFDVWSKDVRIANRIESIGSPGRVLISSSTKSHLTSTFTLEDAEISRRDPELAELQLFYVNGGQRRRSQGYGGSGTMVSDWRNQVSGEGYDDVDTVSEPPASPVRIYPPTTAIEEEAPSPLCPFLRTKRGEINSPRHSLGARDRQASSSIVDIFSKQKQLQKCTSYAELAVPQYHNSGEDVMDRKIVELMEGHNVNFDTYFDPKLKFVTLNFKDADFEATYRDYGRDLDEGSDGEMTETQLGFRIAKQSYMVDTCTLFVNYLLVMIGSAVCLSSDEAFSFLWSAWLGIFLFGLIVELVILFFVFVIFMPSLFPTRFVNFSQFIIQWFVRSMVGLFMIYYPMTIVLVSISRCQTDISETVPGLAHVQMAFFVTVVVLMSSITFMGVSHIAKLIGGFLSCVLFISMLIGVHLELCISNVNATAPEMPIPATTVIPLPNERDIKMSSVADYLERYYTRHVAPEVSILLLLVLILLTVVNRMSETSDRLSFVSRLEASARRRFTRQKKVQAEWLLFNIIPQHVAHSLRTTGKFSQNHECVGVMFASIVNFGEFLNSHNNDEEVLRLLNQIITEFDTLLDLPQFSNIEKIKTIGSTYMAASGLNLPPDQPCTVHHLTELIDFAQHLIDVLEQVNRHGFVFRMRIGINYGPVTSGVVGSHKMLYDIWGDTVNVASRMDTTGLVNKIHMPEHCLERLAPFVSHEVHKIVNVKGKGEMRTVFVTLAPHHVRVRQ